MYSSKNLRTVRSGRAGDPRGNVNNFIDRGSNILSGPTIVTSSLPNGTVGTSYLNSLVATGGNPPYTWGLVSGALPNGLSLNSGGIISGTPLFSGNFTFTIEVMDNSGSSSTQVLNLVINSGSGDGSILGLSITPATLSPATINQAYSQSLTLNGSTASSWSVVSGSLPPGLNFSTNGNIFGTPNTSGQFNFTVQATDINGVSTTKNYTLFVRSSPAGGRNTNLTISPTTLSTATVNTSFTQVLSVSGGSAPYTWSFSGLAPLGLSLNPTVSTGSMTTLTGTPTTSGNQSFVIQVQDSDGNTGMISYTLRVQGGTGLTITTTSLPNATIGTAYTATLTATGGTTPFTWSANSGSLPAGLTLSSNGTISGTPTSSATTSNFVAQVRDQNGQTATQSLNIVVNDTVIDGGFLGTILIIVGIIILIIIIVLIVWAVRRRRLAAAALLTQPTTTTNIVTPTSATPTETHVLAGVTQAPATTKVLPPTATTRTAPPRVVNPPMTTTSPRVVNPPMATTVPRTSTQPMTPTTTTFARPMSTTFNK